MLSDRDLIRRQMTDPAIVRLSRALSRLTSVITYMNTGAHPDDEHSGLLAALRFRYGMRTIICCSTRGEGGQNAIGPERGGALGVVRTREMEEAARALDASIVWLGHGPDDAVFDFGFSSCPSSRTPDAAGLGSRHHLTDHRPEDVGVQNRDHTADRENRAEGSHRRCAVSGLERKPDGATLVQRATADAAAGHMPSKRKLTEQLGPGPESRLPPAGRACHACRAGYSQPGLRSDRSPSRHGVCQR